MCKNAGLSLRSSGLQTVLTVLFIQPTVELIEECKIAVDDLLEVLGKLTFE